MKKSIGGVGSGASDEDIGLCYEDGASG